CSRSRMLMRTPSDPASTSFLTGNHANVLSPTLNAGKPYVVPSSTSGSFIAIARTRVSPSRAMSNDTLTRTESIRPIRDRFSPRPKLARPNPEDVVFSARTPPKETPPMNVLKRPALLLALVSTVAQAQVNAGTQAPEASLPFTMTQVATFNLPWRIAFLP